MTIDYSNYEKEGQVIPEDILKAIEEVEGYDSFSEEDNFFLIEVESPFILADNEFDLHESNNKIIEVNVKAIKTVSFTGGNYYQIYEKDDKTLDSYILMGNEEEGYNIFKFI